MHEIGTHLDEIMTTALRVMGGLEVEHADSVLEPFAPAGACAAAQLEVTGPQGGTVAVAMAHATAAAATARWLGENRVTTQMRDDFVCELVNVVAGNAKALLSPGHHMGLPRLTGRAGPLVVDAARMLVRRYHTGNGPVVVIAGP
jgi:hypothetical protein